jgi:hypothetical protein
MIYVVE